MNATNQSTRLTLVGVMLFFILACNLFTPQPLAPVQVVTIVVPATSDQSLIMPSPSLTFLPSVLPISKSTFTPTFTTTFMLTFTPTSTITNIPTNTPLPPMPDFDDLVTFGGGGGGEECGVAPSLRPALEVHQYNNVMVLCMWGVNFGMPFDVEFTAPDGRIAGPVKLSVDQRTWKTEWEGYRQQEFLSIADWGNNGTFTEVQIWWPIDYPTGQWRAIAYGEGLQASDDFMAQKSASPPYIAALDPRPWNEIAPGIIDRGLHMIQLKGNRRVDMLGLGYPVNSTVYLLTYRANTPSSQDFTLIATQAAYSDFNGSVVAELIGPFDPGQSYLLVGVWDPNTHIAGEQNLLIQKNPHDYFRVLSDSDLSGNTSCFGAPPQRMTVSQRGYVCTRSDSVRLRISPARSASTLVQIEPGTQFTVIVGPSCSDNWSWWNIRLDDGTTGWVSEGGDEIDPYFICPSP
jgi:hypothetical protein